MESGRFWMPGYQGPVHWSRDGEDSRRLAPLQKCYENGVTLITFHETMEFDEEFDELQITGNTIKWNDDHTEEIVAISTDWGGLGADGTVGRVMKFEDSWVVVEIDLRYVS